MAYVRSEEMHQFVSRIAGPHAELTAQQGPAAELDSW